MCTLCFIAHKYGTYVRLFCDFRRIWLSLLVESKTNSYCFEMLQKCFLCCAYPPAEFSSWFGVSVRLDSPQFLIKFKLNFRFVSSLQLPPRKVQKHRKALAFLSYSIFVHLIKTVV